jgi:uncharacterized protein YdhG (YjbR/CyaY superfamily)
MWQCPNCKREFAKQNQNHYCGELPKTIDSYIEAQVESAQPYLKQIHNTIRNALPEAEERISWQMPTFWKKQNVIHFSAAKNHIGLYPGEKAIINFSNRLQDYKTTKGAIQFPYNKPLPLDLIAEIAIWCYKTGNHH